jgi:hypothetical protein
MPPAFCGPTNRRDPCVEHLTELGAPGWNWAAEHILFSCCVPPTQTTQIPAVVLFFGAWVQVSQYEAKIHSRVHMYAGPGPPRQRRTRTHLTCVVVLLFGRFDFVLHDARYGRHMDEFAFLLRDSSYIPIQWHSELT